MLNVVSMILFWLVYFVINTGGVGAVPLYNDGDVRLEGGTTSLEGRVEVYYQGSWGTVCDDYWDEQDAMVVCNQVVPGYHGVFFGNAHFGEGVVDILLDDVQCSGTESSLLNCSHSGMYSHNCRHMEDAGVRCYKPASDGDLQLVGGGVSYQGRVEIFHDTQWGTVCDDSWDLNDATVVCRQLGYTGATDAPQRAYFGAGTGVIFLDDLYCTGDESSLVDCHGADFYQHNCRHYEDASVICIPLMDGDVRLVNGTLREGEVEIYNDGVWWSICASDWDSQDATVACRQLGFSHAQRHGTNDYGSGGGQIISTHFYCEGDETSLAQCEVHDNGRCDTGQATASCHAPDDGDIRLQGGAVFNEGRVEVYYRGQWGTVCDDSWDQQDAIVACTQLGFPGAVQALRMAYFGQGGGSILLNELQCSGSENRLADCQHHPWTRRDCSHYQDAGVICQHHEVGNIRLVDGGNAHEGRVEIWIDERGWMTFCDQGWDDNDGDVVCRQMGYDGLVQITHNSTYGGGTGDVFASNVGCTSQEDALLSCSYDEHSNCTHSDDAGVICAPPDGEVRLVDGDDAYSGRVEIFHENSWWTVCGHWSDAEARVLCHELGYTGVALSMHSFGPGSGGLVEDIYCSAYSATLRDCTVGSNFENTVGCSHDDDVGVVCDGTKFVSGAVRLVNGNVPYAGRVEMFTGDRWGSVCDVAWDIEDARVVCRQVGFKRATYAKKGAFFGRNSYRVVSTGYNCHGSELTLHDCPLSHGTLLSDCTHDNDSSVICEPDSYAEYSVELVGNATYQSSRVSVFYDGQWKSVCSDNWDWRAAQVTCRQAGYMGTSHSVDENAFIDYHPMVFTAHDIVCDGSEYHLYDCSSDWDSPTCTSNNVASVTCATSYEDVLQDGDIRLSNGSSSKEGQVEMFDEGYWRPICGNDWGWEEATVSCRQLGYLGAITGYTTQIVIDDGTEFIWSGLDCNGDEYRLQECHIPNTGWELTSHCQRIGGAECALTQALLRENGDVKLVPDEDSYSGTVAVFYRGVWGKVCPDNWSWSLANTVCFQLGYYGAIEATQNLPDMDDALDYHIHSLQCNEFESHLKYCDLDYAWEDEVECDSDSHLTAGVVCTHQYQDVPSHGKSRLVDGPDIGHVEVFLTDSWGLVCGDAWSFDNARVVCIHLGYRGVLIASSIRMNESLSRDIVMSSVHCDGMESYLIDCPSSYVDNTYCQSMAYVECTTESDELAMQEDIIIRLSDGESSQDGRVEVFILGRWGSICDDFWTDEDAAVVCRHLGYTDGIHIAVYGGIYGSSSAGMVPGHPMCGGWESTLDECFLQTSYQQCYNSDVGVNCDSGRVSTIIILVVGIFAVLLVILIICLCYCCFCKKTVPSVTSGAAVVPGVAMSENAPLPLPPLMTDMGPIPNLEYVTLPSMDDLTLPSGEAPKPPQVVYVPSPNY